MNIGNLMKNLILFLIIFMILINSICTIFNISSLVRYISDIIICILGIYLLINIKKLLINKYIKTIFFVIILFFITTVISYFINDFYSPFLYLWGIKNIIRFFIVFLCSTLVFEKKDPEHFFRIMDVMFLLNIIFSFYQYFVLNCYGDTVAGTFKLDTIGGHIGQIWILIIEVIIVTERYMKNKTNFFKFLFVIMTSVLTAVFAELKAFFIFLILIIGMIIFMNKITKKSLYVVVSVVLSLYIGYNYIEKISPYTAEVLTVTGITEQVTREDFGYATKEDISRFRAFSQIDEQFFNGKPLNKLFGFGLGNCDVSQIKIFRSEFYDKYNYLHYSWFMHSMLYLENGYTGYLLYILILIVCIISCIKFKVKDKENSDIYNFGIILALICILMTWYNAYLRSDTSYFIYVALAIPFITYKFRNKNVDDTKYINSLSKLIEYLKYENKLYFNKGLKDRILSVLTNEPKVKVWKYIKLLRITEYYKNTGDYLYRNIMYTFYKNRKNTLGIKVGINISENSVNKGLLIYHTGIIINGNIKIGENCTLYGENYIDNETKKELIIGNDVQIGVGTKIIGSIEIENNKKIEPGIIINSKKGSNKIEKK